MLKAQRERIGDILDALGIKGEGRNCNCELSIFFLSCWTDTIISSPL
jgi:hypothetical protein